MRICVCESVEKSPAEIAYALHQYHGTLFTCPSVFSYIEVKGNGAKVLFYL